MVLLGLLALARTTHAQATPPPFDSAIDIQTFDYAIGPKTFFTVSDADVSDKKQLSMDALLTYLHNPFLIYNVDPNDHNKITDTRDHVVTSLTMLELTAAYGVTDKLQVGVELPLVFALSGDGLQPDTGMGVPGGINVTGLGDLLVEAKYKLWKHDALRLAGIGALTIPTSFGSDGSQFIGDNLPTVRARLALQYDIGKLALGANGGFVIRKSRVIYDSTIGSQWTWSLGAAYHLTNRFSLVAESYGRTGLTDFSVDNSPFELEGGLRLFATPSVAVVLGGGAGLAKGIGSPDARFFMSVGFAPDVRDSDGDGIPNSRDKCPLIPEDKDGFEDEDGCPDDDNDKDGIPDAEDKCPNEAEDIDGFEDEDGCPDLDNDKDGIPDLEDKCPNDPEDGKMPFPHDGCPAGLRDSDGDGIPDDVDMCPLEEEDLDDFEDGDGCPDLDNDGDGIPDVQDKCPNCAEDKDGFQDADGCPDIDNDHDGIPDSQDKCPNEPETVNGFQDADGCPDNGAVIAALDGDRLNVTGMPSLDGRKLSKPGDVLVNGMALVMLGNDKVTKWLVALSLPSAASAKALGDAIKAKLIAKGLTADKLEIIAVAGPPKIGAAVQERAAPDAPFVCPAGFEAKQRPDRIVPKALMPGIVRPVMPGTIPATPGGPPMPAAEKPVADRDGDGIPDDADKCPDQPETVNGFQDDDGCPDEVPAALKQFSGSIQGVNFKSGSAELLASSTKVLDDAAKAFAEFPALKVEIQGHTDDEPPGRGGKFKDNKELSQARANTVKAYLVGKGVDAAKLTANGYGDSVPRVPIKDLKGAALNVARTKNRRVEFKLIQ